MELIRADLQMVLAVFEKLDLIAGINGVHEVEISVKNEAGDAITIGYGESGEPCILDVTTELETRAIQISPQIGDWTYRPQPGISIQPHYPYINPTCTGFGGDLGDGGKMANFDNVFPLPQEKPMMDYDQRF